MKSITEFKSVTDKIISDSELGIFSKLGIFLSMEKKKIFINRQE